MPTTCLTLLQNQRKSYNKRFKKIKIETLIEARFTAQSWKHVDLLNVATLSNMC